MCCSCITKDCCVALLSFLLLLSSYMSHRFVVLFLSPLIFILLSLITCKLCSPNTALHLASHNTGTDTSDLSISLDICFFCVAGGRSSDRLNRHVVAEFIVVLIVHSTPVCPWSSSFPRYLCCLEKKVPVAAVLECPCCILLFYYG